MRDKKKKTNIKVNDLKPKKDAKGGRQNHNQANQHQSFTQSRNQSVNQSQSYAGG